MRTHILTSLVFGFLTVAGLASSAQACVPGWARHKERTNTDVFGCQLEAARAVREVTGVTPTKVKFDDNTWEIRGFVGDVGIFAYCTASATNICPNRPMANLIILTFSGDGSTDAVTKRDAVEEAFGNPRLIDCNP